MKINNCFKDVAEEDISQEFRLKNIDEIRNHFIEEIDEHELMSKKLKIFCRTLKYSELFLILAFVVTR